MSSSDTRQNFDAEEIANQLSELYELEEEMQENI